MFRGRKGNLLIDGNDERRKQKNGQNSSMSLKMLVPALMVVRILVQLVRSLVQLAVDFIHIFGINLKRKRHSFK